MTAILLTFTYKKSPFPQYIDTNYPIELRNPVSNRSGLSAMKDATFTSRRPCLVVRPLQVVRASRDVNKKL